jgi:hypothetical protein
MRLQVTGAFAEFERSMIDPPGLKRAKTEGE